MNIIKALHYLKASIPELDSFIEKQKKDPNSITEKDKSDIEFIREHLVELIDLASSMRQYLDKFNDIQEYFNSPFRKQ